MCVLTKLYVIVFFSSDSPYTLFSNISLVLLHNVTALASSLYRLKLYLFKKKVIYLLLFLLFLQKMQQTLEVKSKALSVSVIRLLLDVMRNDVIHGDRCCRLIGDELVSAYESQLRE